MGGMKMIITALPLASAVAFTGAAAYINWSSRLSAWALDDAPLLKDRLLNSMNGPFIWRSANAYERL
jgi:hypothetical protein